MGKLLFHYTNDGNFQNIIKDFNMRAVLSTQSNDSKDTILLKELFIDSFGYKILKGIADIEQYNELQMNGLTEILNSLVNKVDNDRFSNFNNSNINKCFVICFTEKKDSRFLWDSYTGNKGISFGFEEEKLSDYIRNLNFPKKTYEYSRFEKVIYNRSDQFRNIKKIVETNFNRYMRKDDESLSPLSQTFRLGYDFTDENGNVIYHGIGSSYNITIKQKFLEFALRAINDLFDLAPFIKHDFWKEENEYRLVLYRKLEHQFLSKVEIDEKGRHYINFPLDKRLLEEVKIGPLSLYDSDNIKKHLTGYTQCEVNLSSGRGIFQIKPNEER